MDDEAIEALLRTLRPRPDALAMAAGRPDCVVFRRGDLPADQVAPVEAWVARQGGIVAEPVPEGRRARRQAADGELDPEALLLVPQRAL